ncbi:MAG: hypothetical protein R6W84_07320 [Promethearchaeia archaeon]
MDFFDDNNFDDIMDEIKKFFNLNSDPFDKFLIEYFNSDDEEEGRNKKSFKISYNYETGMNEPDIRIEGDFNKDIMKDFFGKFENQIPKETKILNAHDIVFDPHEDNDSDIFREPISEINNHDNFTEILLEVPGISFGEISIHLNEIGDVLIFNAQNQNRNYYKEIDLSFVCTFNDTKIELKNGIATIILYKKN